MSFEADSQPTALAPTAEPSPVQAAYQRAARMLDRGEPLRDILSHLTMAAESVSHGAAVCSILLLDREGLLRNGASPNLPADYLDAIDRLKPDPNVGTCAAAAATGQEVVTTDLRADARWAGLRHWPLALGFLGAWSVPIKSHDGRVLGTFGTYFRERRPPTPHERDAVRLLADLAAQAVTAHASA